MILRYQYFTTTPITIPKLYAIGCAHDTRVTRYGPSRRDQYLIHYVLSGRGVFNGTELGRGEGFITTPGIFEHYYPKDDDPWTYLWIISYDREMDPIIEMHHADPGTGIFQFQNLHVVEGVAKRLFTSENSITFTNTEITEMYLSILNNCVCSKSNDKTTNAKLYFDYTVKYISTNLHLPISVNDVCRKLGVSQPYLYKIFQQEIGCSPKQYICECRLAEAKRQLRETEFTISEIAASVGYSDVLAFSKFFSGKAGCSPTEFRKNGTKFSAFPTG